MQKGQHLQFETISTDEVTYEGEVVSAESLDSKDITGILASVSIDGYGETQVLFPGETSYAALRPSFSVFRGEVE